MNTAALERGIFQRTRAAILATNLLNEPLFSIYALLAFILRKDLGATAFQIALLTMLKPMVSIFSLYWFAGGGKKSSLRANVVWAGFLARVPFLFFPFCDNVWFCIAAAALHMLFSRASTPAWMEILKLNMSKKERERSFSQGSALGYAEGVFIAIGFGALLDHHPEAWRLLFFVSALLGMVGVWLQKKVPVCGEGVTEAESVEERKRWKETILWPWKSSWDLMRSRKDFAIFQWGFMACGFGIMLIQPALPLFFVDVLHLSYTDLAIAFSICKGFGFVLTSPVWAKAMGRFSISACSSIVFIGVGLFPLALLLATFSLFWLYLAYIIYGIAQAGSHLIWNLSGPLFAKQEDSLQYTGVNIVMVGMRGMIAPPLGGAFCVITGPIFVLVAGVGLCFLGSWTLMSRSSRSLKKLFQN